MKTDLKIKIDKGESLDKLRDLIGELIVDFCQKNNISYYEILGVMDVIRNDIHLTANEEEETD